MSEKTKLSDEYLDTADATDFVTGKKLAVILAAEYTLDDVITLTFSGDALDDATLANSVTVEVPDSDPLTLKGITFGLLSSSAGEAVYRVTAIEGTVEQSTTGIIVDFTTDDKFPQFNAQDVDAAGGVNVSFSAETNSGRPLDTGGGDARNVDYLEVEAQFSAVVEMVFERRR